MKMNIPFITASYLIIASTIALAGDFTFHLAKHDTREISRESVIEGKLEWSEDDGESIVVSVYSPRERVGELKAEDLDLVKIYNAAKADKEVGPFFSLVDEYIVADKAGRWFLIQYEYRRPGTDLHFDRFRIGRLVRIVEGADLFFLVDYMQDSDSKVFTAKMEELGRLKIVKDLRGEEYQMLLRAAGKEEGEQGGAGQPATASESKPEGDENTKPESEPAPR